MESCLEGIVVHLACVLDFHSKMAFFFRNRSGSGANNGSRSSLARSSVTSSTASSAALDPDAPQPEMLGQKERGASSVSLSGAAPGTRGSIRAQGSSSSVGGGSGAKQERRNTGSGISSVGSNGLPTGGSNNTGRERSSSGSRSGDIHLVRSGWMAKKGVVNLAYRKRWFVLTTKTLLYFETEPSETENDKPKGEIELASVTKVDVKSNKERERLNIYTPTRTYRLRCDTPAESEAWIAAISGAVTIEKQTTLTRPRRGSQTLVESLKHEGDSFVADAVIHRPADLTRWKNWNAFDVSAWLNALNFSLNGVKFFKAGITGDKLASLSTTDLEKMGITKIIR